jgi:hypothetical protein
MRNVVHALLLVSGLAAACGKSSNDWVTPTPAAESDGTPVHIVGVVRHLEVEGGFYAIEGEDGTTYDPTNLPAAFRKDGLAVEADARRRDDMAGIHMSGPIVQLVRIRTR